MKLKAKMMLLGIVPLVLAVVIIYVIGNIRITQSVKNVIENDLLAVAQSQGASIMAFDYNELHVKGDELWNGDSLNITAFTEVADKVSGDAGIDVTIFYGDTRYMTSVMDDGKRVLGTKAGDIVIEKVLKEGGNYFAENVDVVGQPYFACYIPLYDDTSDAPVGMVFTGMPQKMVEKDIRTILYLVLLAAVIVIVVGAIVIYIAADRITKRLNYAISALHKLADGNLTYELEDSVFERGDECGDIGRAIENLKQKLVDIIGMIVEKSKEVRESSSALSGGVRECSSALGSVECAVAEIADSATSQAGNTLKTSGDVAAMGSMVEETTLRVTELKDYTSEMEVSSMEARDTLLKLEEVNAKARDAIGMINGHTNRTNHSVGDISEAAGLISSIAQQTNLLSLNASIEAARAGEAGRGFAVVAGEIQKLAEQSDQSAKRIGAVIQTLMEDSRQAVDAMEEVNGIMTEQNDMIVKMSSIFLDVLEKVQTSMNKIDTISQNTLDLDSSRSGVIGAVEELSAIAQENAATTEETSAAVTEVNVSVNEISDNAIRLQQIAEQLEVSVEQFKLEHAHEACHVKTTEDVQDKRI